MELLEIITRNYDLEPIINIEKTNYGSGNTYLVESVQKKYIAKVNERADFIRVYDRVQQALNGENFKQSRIIRTNEDMVMTPEQLVLYEFIEGSNYRSLNRYQFENAIKYINKYNEVLRHVPFNEAEITMLNHWDKAKSLDFMVNVFADYLTDFDADIKENIGEAICFLAENKSEISELKKQLIHADLGSDNFIFRSDEVISVIDFTPEYNHELYSLSQFIYWNYLWDNQNINKEEINNILKLYNNGENSEIENKTFYFLLIQATLFRVIGPILDMQAKNIKDFSRLNKRLYILREIISIWVYK